MINKDKNKVIERWKNILDKEEFASKFPLENMKLELPIARKVVNIGVEAELINKNKNNENNNDK